MPRPVLYYIRHGLTDWNVEGRLQGRHDVPLNESGRKQSLRCADLLRDLFERDGRRPENFGYVSSPLVRASATMELIRMRLGLDPNGYSCDALLAEISFGHWEGLTYDDVLKRDPDVVARREGNKWRFRPPGGETYEEVTERVGAWQASLAQDTVVTAHGGVARALIAFLRIVPPEEATHQPVDQGVVYVFDQDRLTQYA
jgi:probable phosphoglycerate mutase